MKKRIQIGATLLLLFVVIGLQARHIVGGEITYRCLGSGVYEFTLKVYRDGNCTDCAPLDNFAAISVYNCNDCSSFGQGNFFLTTEIGLQSQRNVDIPDYPCLIPPDVRVEEGIYKFQLNLPVSDQSYHVSYQRCCRNITINNLVTPDDQGSTYTIEITPEAQRSCNNSPVFRTFPPTVICAGEPLSYDHSATDEDGHRLVYELCSPLNGGGSNTNPAVLTTCNGAAPNPACPPPYDEVRFLTPLYSGLNPMGLDPTGNPILSIDPNTGLMTGTPMVPGQFVVGVCVTEYDSEGVELSRVFRDFQFNVAPCDPTVVADIREDAIINDQEFLVNSCGDYTINFVNESYQQAAISQYQWTFNIDGSTLSSLEWSPAITFPGVGQYEGRLVLNPNTDCGDTANIIVNIYPEIEADFNYAYDTCIAGPVQFTDLSVTGAGAFDSWVWEFGDGNISEEQNPAHTYREPGQIPVTLMVRDTNECVDEVTREILYQPVPALIIISPSSFTGCIPRIFSSTTCLFPLMTLMIFDGISGTGAWARRSVQPIPIPPPVFLPFR